MGWLYITFTVSWDYVVGISTCYGLDGPRIKPQRQQDFPHLSKLALGHTQPPLQWVLSHSWGVKWLGYGFNHSPPSNTKVKEKVQQHLYSPSEPSWYVYRVNFTIFTCCIFITRAIELKYT